MNARTCSALLSLLVPVLTGDTPPEPARASAPVALPQSFIEQDDGFLMLGDGLAISLETGRQRWVVSSDGAAGRQRSLVTVEPVGARPDAAPRGEDLLPGVVSRFSGPPSAWSRGQRTYRAVRYAGLWEGVDLVLEAEHQTLKGTYVVAPGADPAAVRMRHHGAADVTIDNAGRLVVHTPSGNVVDAAPVAWQTVDGERRDVPVAFGLEAAAGSAVDVIFALGSHDPTIPLLIDPAVIVQAGFLGGAENDNPAGLAIDNDGYVYVAGWTLSDEASFPVLNGPELIWEGAGSVTQGDAFVAKIDPTGNTLIYAGFIGGTQFDFASDIAVDSQGCAYVGGHTGSTENQGFPVVAGPDLTFNGGIEGWVARVSPNGTSLDFCGYVGGNSEDRIFGIDVDDTFRTYIVGRFESIPATLPLSVGPYLSEPGGATDSFIARLSPSGTSFDYCGYLGGSGLEDITQVAADSAGGAVFAGWTGSTDFPAVGNLGTTYNAGADVVVGRVASDGTGLTWSGYIGSSLSDFPYSITVDNGGSVYVAGWTGDAASFPTAVGPNLVPSDTVEGFLTKVADDGQSLEWSGFTGTGYSGQMTLGPDLTPWFITAVAGGAPGETDPALGRVDPSGTNLEIVASFPMPSGTALSFLERVPASLTPGVTEFWLLGSSTDDETEFPVVSGPDVTANGNRDAVVVKIQVADDPWTDLGFALSGTTGDPVLTGTGTLGSLSPLGLSLSNARASTTAWLVYGVSAFNAPFYGGIMVPDPAPPGSATPLFTSPAGTIDIAATWPSGVPSGFSLYLQYWVEDPGGIFGFAASNALQGTTP